MNLGIHHMCHSDLRNFVKLFIGLLNNINTDEIINHAQLTFHHCGTLEQYRNIHYTWFDRTVRDIAPAELLEPFRFTSHTYNDFTFNPLAIIDYIAGPNASKTWDETGNLIASNLLSYI